MKLHLVAVVLAGGAARQEVPELAPSVRVGEHKAAITHLTSSRDGKVLFTVSGSQVHAWNVKKSELLWSASAELRDATPMRVAAFAVGGDTVSWSPGAITVFQFEAKTGEPGKNASAPNFADKASCMAADGKDRWVWIGSEEGNMTRLVPGSGTGWSIRKIGNGGVTCLARSKDDKLIALGGSDGTVRFLEPQKSKLDEERIFAGHPGPVQSLAFDPKSTFVVSGCEDGSIRKWGLKKGAAEELPGGHDGARITGLVCDPKGRLLASADDKGKVVLWDLKELAPLATLKGDVAGPVVGLAFVGKDQLAGADGDRVAIWDLSEL